jgi:colicin import membrane protein
MLTLSSFSLGFIAKIFPDAKLPMSSSSSLELPELPKAPPPTPPQRFVRFSLLNVPRGTPSRISIPVPRPSATAPPPSPSILRSSSTASTAEDLAAEKARFKAWRRAEIARLDRERAELREEKAKVAEATEALKRRKRFKKREQWLAKKKLARAERKKKGKEPVV